MKKGSLMRVWFCKIKFPFICFCKPTAAPPLKLETTPHVTPFADSQQEPALNGNRVRSCIKKPLEAANEVGKKRVQWMDNYGKQLAEIKEFESSETGDTDSEDDSSRCLCIIL